MPRVDNFKDYINFEKHLLALIKCKADKGTERTGGSIEARIIKKIGRLYKETLKYFPTDYNTLCDYFKHCKNLRAVVQASDVVEKLLEVSYKQFIEMKF